MNKHYSNLTTRADRIQMRADRNKQTERTASVRRAIAAVRASRNQESK